MKKYKSVKVKTKCGDVIELPDCMVHSDDKFFVIENDLASYFIMLDSVVWVRKLEY